MSATQRQVEPVFQRNEFYDTLLRIKRDQPVRYARQIGPGIKSSVENYERRKLSRAETDREGRADEPNDDRAGR